jgi:hypothetical protein
MVIQIERLSEWGPRGSTPRCSAPQCTTAASWFLVDRDMPESHEANIGERPCCTVHIAATYLSLRGAHLIAQTGRIARVSESGAYSHGHEPRSARRSGG